MSTDATLGAMLADEEVGGSFVDVAALLNGGLPESPAPTICSREDGYGLFYEGQVNVLFGDPESGKSWIAYAAGAEVVTEGKVLVLDADHNGAEAVIGRFLSLGIPGEVLADPRRFRLYEPEDREDLVRTVHEGVGWAADVVVVDSMGEVLPLLGLSSNSPDDYTAAHRAILRPFAIAGACVIVIDHPAKGMESRQQGPSGTAAKRRAVALSLRVTLDAPFAPGQVGRSTLSILKDRHGGLRGVSAAGRSGVEPVAGVFELDSTDATLTWVLRTPTDAVLRPDQKVSDDDLRRVLALPEEQRSTRGVKALGFGSGRAGAVLRAYRALTPEECSALLTPLPGSRGAVDQKCSRSAPGAVGSAPPLPGTPLGSGEHLRTVHVPEVER